MKKRPVGMLLTLLLALTLLPVANAADATNTINFTNNPRENIGYILQDGGLTVTNLPDNDAFNSVWISMVNNKGRTQTEKVMERKADGTASMPLNKLSDGEYYIEMYFYTGSKVYNSYIYGKEIKLSWNNGSGTFMLQPPYEHNKKTYDAGRSDAAALVYYLAPSTSIQSTDPEIVKLANEITNDIADDYDKALAIHDWMCTNIWYDWDVIESSKRIPGDAVSVLKNRLAICEGYSNLTAALLRASDIPAKTVSGHGRLTAKTGDWTQNQLSGKDINHFWNEAYIDGRWVIIDTTWDCGNDYRGGKKVSSNGIYYYRYFDATIEAFSANHYIEPYKESMIPLQDNPSPWAARQVNTAIASGLIPQTMRVKYRQATTRADFCALAVTLYETITGERITGRTKFVDTTDVNVEKIAYLGVAVGVGGNRFAPNDPLNREQAAIMVSRLADVLGKPLPSGAVTFNDSDNVSPWALEAVGKMQAASLMDGVGDNEFSPKSVFTREQSIVAIIRLYDYCKTTHTWAYYSS